MAAEMLQLKQRLQSAEEEIARLHEEAAEQAAVVQPLQEEVQRLRPYEEAVCKERYGPCWNGKATDVDIIDNLTRLRDCSGKIQAIFPPQPPSNPMFPQKEA